MEAEGPVAVKWIGWGVVVCILIIATLLFLQTRDLTVLFLGGLLSVAILSALWVAIDARSIGQPTGPWALVAFILPGVGLLAYLVVRALRPRAAG